MAYLLWPRALRYSKLQTPIDFIPVELAPALGHVVALSSQRCRFSTCNNSQFPRDRNPNRGVSALHRTGPRHALSVSKEPLPRPVKLDAKERYLPKTDPNHGLWKFFNEERTALSKPDQLHAHGRAWTVEELRHKSWEDLHHLWWKCVLERNRIATDNAERKRLKAGYGEFEATDRDDTVKKTQHAIKHALTERWYAWQQAKVEARTDPELEYVPGQRAITIGNFEDYPEPNDDNTGVESPAELPDERPDPNKASKDTSI